ncbi:MAG: hypothetical protein MH208_19335 [Marinobacter sp.]|nr:hypothetical protein [Marinobacter sp.]
MTIDNNSTDSNPTSTADNDISSASDSPVIDSPTTDRSHTSDLRFSDLNLDHRLQQAIAAIGFEYCTPDTGRNPALGPWPARI